MSVVTAEELMFKQGMKDGFGAKPPEADVDRGGSDLTIYSDIERMQLIIEDDLSPELEPIRSAASILLSVMDEFVADEEDFRPQEERELRNWLGELLTREVTDLSAYDREQLLDTLIGFPPASPAEAEYGREQTEGTRGLLNRGEAFAAPLTPEDFL